MWSFNKNNYKTHFFLPLNGFIIGIGSIFNIFGSYFSYNYSKTEQEADYKAIACDWGMVANDFQSALKSLTNE